MFEKRQKLINKIENIPATQRQIKFMDSMGIKYPKDATKSDAEAFIARYLDDDEAATEDLKAYADAKEILHSPYVGNKWLHNLLFDNLKPEDKAAFFCFCVYKFNFDRQLSEGENLLNHPKSDWFKEFGQIYKEQILFMDSIEDYMGEEIIAFGKSEKITEGGKKKTVYGGSIYTLSYKEALKYLEAKKKLKY